MTPNQVARLLMVSPVTVRQWARKGTLQAFNTPGGHRRFFRSEVERFAREHQMPLANLEERQAGILVVEDDVQVAQFLVDLFAYADPDLRVEIAHDGFDAGSKVQTFKPDVVLLDLMLPGLDGFEVCRKLKGDPNTKAIRIIAMTGHFTPEVEARIIRHGAEACVAKPIDRRQLFALLGLSPKGRGQRRSAEDATV